jgi:dolichol-phosphate mannosyltransferase
MKLAIVIPTYNEGKTLPSLIDRLVEQVKHIVDDFNIVIVDDSSPDGTADIARNLAKKFREIIVIQRPAKLGLGAAYKNGFRYVLEKLGSDFIIEMDADHSHDPSEIPNMIKKIGKYDFLIASRHVKGSATIGWGIWRKLTHAIAVSIARQCAKLDISDPTSGFRMFKNETLQQIDFEKIKSDGYAFQIEVLHQLKQKGMKGLETITTFVDRKEGKSKMGKNEMLQFVKTCISYLRKKN